MIYVKSGVYIENVVIGDKFKNLMLVGDGMKNIVIIGSKSVGGGFIIFDFVIFGKW